MKKLLAALFLVLMIVGTSCNSDSDPQPVEFDQLDERTDPNDGNDGSDGSGSDDPYGLGG